MQILIVGASARAAAFSALRAGWHPICSDLFADRDLAAACPATRIAPGRYPDGLADFADAIDPTIPCLYTGALENHPAVVDRIAASRPLWGNPGPVLHAVRDPIAVATALKQAGLPHAEARLNPIGLPIDGSWLRKPLRSAGGRGIRPFRGEPDEGGRPAYYQERLAGPSFAALYVGSNGGAQLVGLSRQWVGRPGSPFAYRGSLGGLSPGDREAGRLAALGECLAVRFGLLGLFGVDLVRTGVGFVPVEINPRYTASAEVIELANGVPLLLEHRRAFDPAVPKTNEDRALGGPRFAGKVILFAPRSGRLGGRFAPRPRRSGTFDPLAVADVPATDELFEPGDPVLTVLARGSTPRSCRARLRRRLGAWTRAWIAGPEDRGTGTGRTS